MPAEMAKGVIDIVSCQKGDLKSQDLGNATKKSRESDRRRRRRKQKKNNKASKNDPAGDNSDTAAEDVNGTVDDTSEENFDPLKVQELVEVEYVPERAELDGELSEEFRKVFEKFNFKENVVSEEDLKKDDSAPDAAAKKKGDSDSEEEEQDTPQKEKGISNKKKKLQRQ